MKLTVITVTHKRAKKLASVALPSILAQTVKSFEWIIVNDGRDIATRDLIEIYESKHRQGINLPAFN